MLIPLLSLFLLAVPLESAANARGIPIIWGHGETVSQVGELPPDVTEAVASELGQNVSVGFVYDRFHIYYADIWTWNGRHVLFHGDQYWSVDDSQWESMLGDSVESQYGKPLLYRFPLGSTLLAVAIVLWTVFPRVFPSDEAKLQKLFKDARYTKLVEKILPSDDHALRTQFRQEDVDSAVADLISQGIPEPKGRRNLDLMLTAVCAARESRISELFIVEQQCAAIGSAAQRIATLEQLVAALPVSDPRYQQTAQLLSKLREDADRAAVAGEDTTAEV